jgi:hypothetical protein
LEKEEEGIWKGKGVDKVRKIAGGNQSKRYVKEVHS